MTNSINTNAAFADNFPLSGYAQRKDDNQTFDIESLVSDILRALRLGKQDRATRRTAREKASATGEPAS